MGYPSRIRNKVGTPKRNRFLVTEMGGSGDGLGKKIVANLLDARVPLSAVALGAGRRPYIPKLETTHG